ncbi:MAG: hypothetical protein PHY18_06605 [Dehalococcoidales bacterium]|nr:hypothetical protein [Dehalococcoidales bacterium]
MRERILQQLKTPPIKNRTEVNLDKLTDSILKEITEGLTVISDEDILVNACANCTREGVWSDEDCKYCQMNMRVSARAQHDHIIKQIKGE